MSANWDFAVDYSALDGGKRNDDTANWCSFFGAWGLSSRWFSAPGLPVAAHGAVTDRKSRTWNLEQNLQQPRSSAEDVSAARNSVSDSLYHSQAGRWRCFGPAKASYQSRVHCSCHLFFELEDEAISVFLCTTTKHTTLTTDPPGGAPALAAKLPARETTAGAPNGPCPASHWAASSNALVFYRPMPVPPFPFQSLIRGGGVLTADRRHPSTFPIDWNSPPDIPRRTHVDDSEPVSPEIKTEKKKTQHPCPSAPQLWVSQEQQHAVPFPQPWRRRHRRRRQHQWLTPSGKR